MKTGIELPLSDQDHLRLLAVARRLLGSSADAEDTVHDAYLRVLALAPQAVDEPMAWLTTMVRHLAIDTLRKQQRGARLHNVSDGTALAVSAEDQTGSMEQVRAALRRLADSLSPDEAAMLLLFEVFEHSHADIASKAGKSEAACRQTVHRARRRLTRDHLPGPEDRATADALYALCLRALQTHSPAPMYAVLARPIRSVALAPDGQWATPAAPLETTPRSGIVSVDGGYALVLVHEDRLLCCLPLGPLGEVASRDRDQASV